MTIDGDPARGFALLVTALIFVAVAWFIASLSGLPLKEE